MKSSALEEDRKFVTAAWIPRDEVLCRIESHVLQFLQEMTEYAATKSKYEGALQDYHKCRKVHPLHTSHESHSFKITKRTADNAHHSTRTGTTRLGRVQKNRDFLKEKSLGPYTQMWQVMAATHRLIQGGKYMTQRDLFYRMVNQFSSQQELNERVQDVAALLECPRISLGIYASSRGYIAGCLRWNVSATQLDQ